MSAALVAICAFGLDMIFGDPQTRWHPVALLGRLIARLEHLLYPEQGGNQRRLAMGAVLTALILCFSYAGAQGLLLAAQRLPVSWGVDALSAILLYFTISPHMLAKAGRDIYALLAAGNLTGARERVGWIVGRDTERLDEADVARATIETIAENTVDGVIAPLFFFAIGGACGSLPCGEYDGLHDRLQERTLSLFWTHGGARG